MTQPSTLPTTATLLAPGQPDRIRSLLQEIGAQGWLLYDMGSHNPLAHRLLGLGKTTRRAFALFPDRGQPRLLHHAIEASAWRNWPWSRRSYSSWEELETELATLLDGLDRVAMETSPRSAVPTVDRVPAGVVELVREQGVDVMSSGDLITAFHSLWDAQGLETHLQASRILRETAMAAFGHAAAQAGTGTPVRERELMNWLREELARRGVTEQVACIVANGPQAADPHYDPDGPGEPLRRGALVLLDLWGGLTGGGIPADQTWMGVLGGPEDVTPRIQTLWEAVRDAREGAIAFMTERAGKGEPVQGWEVDRVARDLLRERGLDAWFSHRLGHSIDASLHGSGPNLDHLETRDERTLLTGVGFSVEPGVYIPGEVGIRSEVNVYWDEDGPRVTTPDPQDELLFFPTE